VRSRTLRAAAAPDGSQVAFSSREQVLQDVYVTGIEGGVPRRLTREPTGSRAVGWSSDGAVARRLEALPWRPDHAHLAGEPELAGSRTARSGAYAGCS